jgi:hypothetical protein
MYMCILTFICTRTTYPYVYMTFHAWTFAHRRGRQARAARPARPDVLRVASAVGHMRAHEHGALNPRELRKASTTSQLEPSRAGVAERPVCTPEQCVCK